ncbi:hypothetical protein [Burkholderia cenocepacia]|uniref:hypothetical protein n=1 Tax=Burkholderia cenocepacia TaxID=95486 RepID=UPI001BA2AB5E|nr:hypothetical protein [Burkholderia cenocepacia]MBR8429045.1 hypothetical protein [Burkholderia cenocepacia]
MDLTEIEPAVILARGQYATVNGEYKRLLGVRRDFTQRACDDLRWALNSPTCEERNRLLDNAELMLKEIRRIGSETDGLKTQKDELWNEAWGK